MAARHRKQRGGSSTSSERRNFETDATRITRAIDTLVAIKEAASPLAAPGQGVFSGLVLLGVVFAGILLVWLAGYAVVVSALGRWLRGRVRRAIDAVAGTVHMILGVRLAIEQRSDVADR